METTYIKCKCNAILTENEFKSHFPKCNDFKVAFRDFDMKFAEILKSYSQVDENFLIIRVLLDQYRSVIDQRIKSKGINFKPVKEVKQESFINDYKFPQEEIQKCSLCQGFQIDFYLDCIHPICKDCFYKLAEENFADMKCPIPICNFDISYMNKKEILGKDFTVFEENATKKLLGGNIIICVNNACKSQLVFEKGNTDFNVRNDKGDILSKQAAIHYAENRCRCPNCKIDFCVSCKITPYHMGKTCLEFKSFSESKKCRIDNAVITNINRGPADDVCSNPDCVETYKTSCGKKLKCGHNCGGAKGELNCLNCLVPTCKDFVNLYDQNEDSYCPICFAEGLGNCPTIKLNCGHMFHHKCIQQILKNKWIGPKIIFSYLNCSQCKTLVDAPNNPDIQALILESKNFLERIIKMVGERLKIEGIDKDPRLQNPSDPYYGKLNEYAMHKISYYLCSKCNNPYFAGLRDCRGGPGNEEANNNNNDNNNKYDKNDLVCGGCVNLNGVAGISNCQVHGKEFIEYKCKFCCAISSWFCWGTTHFCEDCHSRQCKGDYLTKYTKDKLPKCQGEQSCKLKIKHPENGEEFALGCAICRNNADNFKKY